MPDNVTAPATGTIFASDEVGGAHYPYSKLAFGADNTAIIVADANGARLPVQIGGTLPAFAATPTFALDAPSLAALENTTVTVGAALPAGTNNIGDVDVLTVPVTATTSRNYGASMRIATAGAGSVRTVAGVTATEITLSATVDGFFAIGDGTVTAADAAGSFPIFAGIPFTRQITSGQFVAFIRAGATDGALFVAPVA